MNKLSVLIFCIFSISETVALSLQDRRDRAASMLAENQSFNLEPFYRTEAGFIFSIKPSSKQLNTDFKEIITTFDNLSFSKKQLFNKTKALDSRYPTSFQKNFNLGILLYRMKKYPSAEMHFRLAFEFQPLYWKSAYWLGKTTKSKGGFRLSEQWFKLAYRLNPDDFQSLIELADIYIDTDQNLKLKSMAAYFKYQKPNSPELLLLLGKIEMRNRDYARAYAYFSDKLNSSLEAGYLAYRSAFLTKNFPEADFYLKQTIKKWKPGTSLSLSKIELELKLKQLHVLMLKEGKP